MCSAIFIIQACYLKGISNCIERTKFGRAFLKSFVSLIIFIIPPSLRYKSKVLFRPHNLASSAAGVGKTLQIKFSLQ